MCVLRRVAWDCAFVGVLIKVLRRVCSTGGADKSLSRPGSKQSSCQIGVNFLERLALQEKKNPWWQLASRRCWYRARPWYASELVSFLVGLRTYQHPGTGRADIFIWFWQWIEDCNAFILNTWRGKPKCGTKAKVKKSQVQVRLRQFRVTIFTVQKQEVLRILSTSL